MIELKKLELDITMLANRSRALKQVLRASWTRPVHEEQRIWLQTKRRITELLVLLAWSRGRLHTRSIPRDVRARAGTEDVSVWHARVAERTAKDYASPPAMLEPVAREAT